jgi:type IV secretion system protein VirB4
MGNFYGQQQWYQNGSIALKSKQTITTSNRSNGTVKSGNATSTTFPVVVEKNDDGETSYVSLLPKSKRTRKEMIEVLEVVEDENGFHSEIMEFLGRIVNCGNSQPYLIPIGKISNHLSINRLYFGTKAIEVHGLNGVRYAGIVSIKEYRPSTHAGVMDNFMKLPFELIISQSFSYIDRMIAISSMQLQQRRLMQSEDVAHSQIQAIDEALDSAMSGVFAFGTHHLTILCIHDSIKQLETALSYANVELSNTGITGTREKINLEPAYWAQLPGNESYMARRSTVNSLNVASFASFHFSHRISVF